MKFVVVLVAAGVLAFLGAVICIIAGVYARSSPAGPQALADNRSLSTESLLQPLSPGSVAYAGPLGALHGSESYEGGGLGLGMEVPTLNELSPGQVTGENRKQYTFSRLICTPIPVGDCKSKGFNQQADDPYADDEWHYLRTTAEELRQTVMQQNDQIEIDQRTIGELTGKLSECESGLEDTSISERSVGVWAGNRRLMAGDDVSASAAAQLQTARAVEELEKAILQLKDRIEKLEAEIGPAPVQNHTDVGTKGFIKASGKPSWRVEDLEGELEKKMELLEKERKALRKETQGHHKEIDEGLNTLHNRIAELEQSLTDYSYPEGYKLSFPVRTNYMYGMVRKVIPEMYAFTACMWLKPTEGGIGTPFSYAVPEQPNELVLLQGVHNPVELLINDKVAQLPLSLPVGLWQHICISWTLRDGVWRAYQGGKLKGQGEGLAAWHPIRPGGVLILGQEQDTLGGRFDASQALVGELSKFNMWDRVLSPTEVSSLASCSGSAKLGNVSPWTDRDVDVLGGATKEPVDPCARGSGPQQ
ncbi:neuronal pentraxin receptor b [Sardina pilchardus]|uniref:neuronal pentraxin receptor b n=1 Tax=Sardina pilchardus TaxID=27697 RepID=UPI002E1631BA